MKKYYQDLVSLIFLIIAIGIFFYPTIISGKLPVPSDALVGLYNPWRDYYGSEYPRGVPFKNFLITDPVRQQIPWREIAMTEWKSGHIPGWNPYNFSGSSLIGNIQSGAFYPLNIVFFLFDFPIAWTVLIILEPILGGILLYVYLRNLKIHPFVSLFGSLCWIFSGFSIAWMTWGTIVHAALWLPLLLLCVDRIIDRKERKILWILLFISGLVSQFFAGHIQISLYVLMVTAVYTIRKMFLSTGGRRALYIWLGFIILFIITSVQWIPFSQTFLASSRSNDAQNWIQAGWFLPWQHIIQFIIPDFFGNPATGNYWGVWNYGEFIGYIGATGLVFAVYALAVVHNTAVKFWGGLLAVVFLFLLPTPIARIPYELHIPILSSLQPTRLLVIVDFILVILAAYGLQEWIERKKYSYSHIIPVAFILSVLWASVLMPSTFSLINQLPENLLVAKRNMIIPSIFYLLVFLYMMGSRWFERVLRFKQYTVFFLLVITSIDLIRFGWKFTPFTSASYFFPQTKVTQFLNSKSEPYRIASTDPKIFPPNTASFYHIEAIEGYDPVYDGRYEEYMAALNRGTPNISPPFGFNRIVTTDNVDTPLLPLLNVRYVLTLKDIQRPYLTKVFQEGETRVYEDSRYLPRVFLVNGVKNEQNKQKIMEDLYAIQFRPLQTAIIEKPIVLNTSELGADEVAQIQTYDQTTNTIVVTSSTRSERYLVVSIPYNTHWRIKIDGKSADISRADYILFGTVVPQGNHRISIYYE